ncbi:DUF2846 domain-containing protein [Hymenobacter terrenus]|uniref:DUF2846 domain-containing protein n=1 Tax=Hymenobacter terrenus TaxID=1629124 RepID=UPI0006190C93|nr:DUF2846 domain-containing protein [Hymenobacter terrenus]
MKTPVHHLLTVGLFLTSTAFQPAVQPPDNVATVYIYRNGRYRGAPLNHAIYINGVQVCKLSNKRYIEYKANPGTIDIIAQSGGIEVLKFETALKLPVEAGHTYYVRGKLKTNLVHSSLELSEVAEDIAKPDIAKLTVDRCQNKDK